MLNRQEPIELECRPVLKDVICRLEKSVFMMCTTCVAFLSPTVVVPRKLAFGRRLRIRCYRNKLRYHISREIQRLCQGLWKL